MQSQTVEKKPQRQGIDYYKFGMRREGRRKSEEKWEGEGEG